MASSFLNLDALLKEAGLSSSLSRSIPSLPLSVPPSKKIRFLLVATHAHQMTGYSKVSYHIIQQLAKDPALDLFHFGFQKFATVPPEYRPYPPHVDVYDPAGKEREAGQSQEMGFGFSQLANYVRKVKPDVMMIYNDAGVICRFLDNLDESLRADERTYKTLIYLDQVFVLQRPELLSRIDKVADAYFTFTSYWREVLVKQGIVKPIHILRHGFDPTQFKRMDRAALRAKHKIPEHVFLLLNLNRNTPRKRYDLVMIAFAELVVRNPTKPLALMAVCDVGQGGGYPIQEIYVRELEKLGANPRQHLHKLMIVQQSLSFTDEVINELYCMSDVGITAAEGEGFGLCQFEAMGVGIPQVCSYVGGFRDFCRDGENCRAVKPRNQYYLSLSASSVGGVQELVDPHELSLAVEDYVMDSDLRKRHGEAARRTVLDYEWSKEVETLRTVILSFPSSSLRS
jgi:glycosyltransferase involved in cell wall biosynthesis